MGSFNTTCAISKTPIVDGQKAIVFFLVWNSHTHHYTKRTNGQFAIEEMGCTCYPYDKYKVIGYPLLGVYDDRNKYVFEDKDIEKLTLNAINQIYMKNEVKEGFKESDYNSCHDFLNIEFIEDMEMAQIMEHSGALRVKTPYGISFVAKMAIHEKIYKEMILDYSWKNYKQEIFNFSSICEKLTEKFLFGNDVYSLLEGFQLDRIERLKTRLMEKLGEKDHNENLITEDSIESELLKYANVLLSSYEESSHEERDNWRYSINSNPAKDVLAVKENPIIANKIIEAWVGGKLTNEYFLEYNMEFAPVMISGQEFDFEKDEERLRKMSEIVREIEPDCVHEESIKLEKEFIDKKYLSLKILDEKINEWIDKEEDDYIKYLSVMENIKINNIKSYIVGDGSEFDLFAQEFNLFNNEELCGMINFKD